MDTKTNEESMEIKKRIVTIVENSNIIEEIELEVKKAQGKWMSLKERRYQAQKERFLDFRNAGMSVDEEIDANAQNQITRRVRKKTKADGIQACY